MPQIISNGIKYTNGNPFSGKYEDLEGKPTVFGPSGPKAKEGFVPSPSTTAGTTKYLREDGTWAVPPDTDTTYSDMKGATASAAGEHGLAPAPSAGAQNKYLTGGATYQNVDDHAATFTSTDIDDGSANAWTNVAKLTSGEKHSSIFNKLSTMFKNVRYLYRMLGTTDISGIGDGTVTGAIRELNTGINPKGVGKNRFILYPEDGIVDFGSESRITGLLRVVFPQDWSNTMLRFIVSIFNYKEGTCADYYISGYPYSVEIGDGAWYECTAISIGRKGKVFSDLPVKFGKTENGETAITIGNINTVWNYPKVYIHDIMVGQNNVEFDKWTQGWGLKICPYEMDTIQTTISHPHITYEEPIIYRRISPESDTFPWGNSVVKSKIKSMHGAGELT